MQRSRPILKFKPKAGSEARPRSRPKKEGCWPNSSYNYNWAVVGLESDLWVQIWMDPAWMKNVRGNIFGLDPYSNFYWVQK